MAIESQAVFNNVKTNVINSLQSFFPVKGKKHELILDDIWADDNLQEDDFGAQNKAYEQKGDFSIPINASLTLKDISGATIDKVKKVKILNLPKSTTRSTYILKGTEYQVPHQLLLKPNVYNRVKGNGELETFINIKPVGLHLSLDAQKGTFTLQFGSQKNMYLYNLLLGIGITDAEMAQYWGDDVLAINKKTRSNPETEVNKFYEMAYNKAAPSYQDAITGVLSYLSGKALDPEATKLTIGSSHAKLSPEVILLSSKKLLDLNKGVGVQDEKDALHFKKISNIEDFLSNKLDKERNKLLFKIKQRLDSKDAIRDILKTDVFDTPIHTFFNGSVANHASMLNPLATMSEQSKVIITGEGGIENEYAITKDARAVHPSQLGFIDPIHTTEGSGIGTTTHLSVTAKKQGDEIVNTFYDVKNKKNIQLTPIQASQAVVSFADQYENHKPKYPKVKVSDHNQFKLVDPALVDYIFLTDKQVFSLASNMIPFLNHISGNRSMMAGKHMEQALPLKYREAPLVQNKLSDKKTFENLMASSIERSADKDGVIQKVTDNYIDIKTADGVDRKHLYNKYINPTDKVYYDHTAIVKEGDSVTKGQVLTSSNFTKGDSYAVGTNLNVAFMPYKGYTFEDGIAISESAAKKLTSLHMYKKHVNVDSDSILDKNKFLAFYPTKISQDSFNKLDSDGVIKEGTVVKNGDYLVAHLHKEEYTKEDVLMSKFSKKFLRPYKDRSILWEEDVEGKVHKIIRRPKEIEVQIETEEQAVIGDKISFRQGNKGIITHIIKDNDVPKTESGTSIDVFLNPQGIAGRVNPAQIIEAYAGKIAQKEGKVFISDNFSGENYAQTIERNMRQHGIKEKEYITQPDGTKIENPIATGIMHALKLNHPVRKKYQVRETGSYNADLQPMRGNQAGASKMDQIQLYSMLSHGALKNLQDASTIKGEKNDDYWHAYQAGLPLPKPRTPFVFDKFVAMLKSTGVDMTRNGDQFQLIPMTQKDVLKTSNGEITEPEFLQAKNLNTIKNGLFDHDITGGSSGDRWSHIELSEELPNPMFEGAIIALLGIKKAEFNDLVRGKKFVDSTGAIGDKGVTGGAAIKKLLSKIDVKSQLTMLEKSADGLTGSELDTVNRKIRYLKVLNELGEDATIYMSKHVPVIPPKFRPIVPMEGKNLNIAPANTLYKDMMLVNNQLKEYKKNGFPDSELSTLRSHLYHTYGALIGTEDALTDAGEKQQEGFLKLISGKKPKEGFFQKRMVAKRQDYSARTTVVPEPDYGIDDIGMPEDMLWKLYKPHIVRKLQALGYTPNRAIEEVDSRSQLAKGLLAKESEDRPVIINRAPSLHKFSVMAFNPKVIQGKAIKINPLVTSGYNMDFDGDSCFVKVIVSININDLHQFLKSGKKLDLGDYYVDTSSEESYIIGVNKWIKERTISMPSKIKLPVRSGNTIIHVDIKDFPRIGSDVSIGSGVIKHKIPDGISIFTCENDTRKIVEVPVTEFSIHPNLENYLVSFSDGNELLVSDDHSLIYLNPETKLLDKIKPVDSIDRAIPKIRNLEIEESVKEVDLIDYSKDDKWTKVKKSVALDEKLGHLIGMMAGDGWLSLTGGGHGICFCNVDDNLIKAFSDAIDSLLESPINMYSVDSHHEFDGHQCFSRKHTKNSVSLAQNIETWIGSGAKNKHLPSFFMSSPKEFRFGLLAGLIDTDGSSTWIKAKSKNKPQYGMWLSTTSERLALETITLCRSLGISASITLTPKEYRVVISCLTVHDKPIKLRHTQKVLNLQKYQSIPLNCPGNQSRNDLVPFNKEIFEIAKKTTKGGTSDYVVMNRSKCTISRLIARRLIEKCSEFPKWWLDLVNDEKITWIHVKKIQKNPNKITMYDITAPGPYTFMTAEGIIVQDTIGVHVPISQGAVDEAYRMLPSNNLFNPQNNDLMHLPQKEQIAGLYMMTTPGKKTNKNYSSLKEVMSDYYAKKLNLTDVISVKGKSVTVGSIIVNLALPEKYRSLSEVMTKKRMESILLDISKTNPTMYGSVASKLKDLGNDAVYKIGLTTGLSDLKIDYGERDRIVNDAKKSLASGGINAAITHLGELNAMNKASLKSRDSGFSTLMESGALGGSKSEQVRQMTATPFIIEDHNRKPIPMIIDKSYTEGLDSASYFGTLSGARLGMIDRSLSTSKPGEFTKEIINSMISTRITEKDCGTHQGVMLPVTDKKNLLGRYTTEGQLIDDAYLNKHKGLIKVRSPITCESLHPPCAMCFGLDEKGQLPQIGTFIGTIAGQSITEPSTQMTMRKFHTGGSVGANRLEDIHGGFERVEQILNLPKIVPDKATLSEVSGIVDEVMIAPQGGWFVHVAGHKHYVPGGLTLTVKTGSKVEKGDRLSTGVIKPQELAELKGAEFTKLHMVDELDKAYTAEGRFIRRPLLETVVSSVISKGHVLDPGKSDYSHGDYVNINTMNKLNKSGDGIKYQPVFEGLSQAPLLDEDFLTRLNFQRLKETLQEGAAQGWKSDIHGNSPLPSYVSGETIK